MMAVCSSYFVTIYIGSNNNKMKEKKRKRREN